MAVYYGNIPGFIPGNLNQATENDGNLPDWMQQAIGNVGQIGPGAASYVSSSGPQEFSKLLDMYNQSIGKAPTMVDESRLRSLFQDQIAAAMQLGGEQINTAEGERGAAVRPGGVATQKMMDLGLKVQEPMVQALVSNLFGDVQNQNSRLASLFGAASGNQSNSLGYRNTTQDINSQLPPYVQQSNPNGGQGGQGGNGGGGFSSPGGSAKPGGGGVPGGGGGGGTPWWQTSYGDMNQGKGSEWNDKNAPKISDWGNPSVPQNYNDDWWNAPGYPGGPNEGAGGAGDPRSHSEVNPSSYNSTSGLTWDNVNGYFITRDGKRYTGGLGDAYGSGGE